MNAFAGRASSVITSVATAIVIVTLVIVPFFSPQWFAFEQGRAQATAWTQFTPSELDAATGSILSDLIFGPPDFDVAVRGQAVLDERERGHMRDVRTVFAGLFGLGVVAAVALVVASRRRDRQATWRAVRRGAVGLGLAVVALGAAAFVAFDALFETMHRLLFPAGSYDFDPATERLVQLFPFQFWQETAIVVGVVIVLGCAVVAAIAGSRASAARPADEAARAFAAASDARS